MKTEINQKLKICKSALKSLGADRATSEQQAAFILNIVTKFQEIVDRALATNYGCDDLFDLNPNLRLATVLVHREDRFARTIEHWGQEYHFNPEEQLDQTETEDNLENQPEHEPESKPKPKKKLRLRDISSPQELDDILYDQETITEPGKSVLEWIRNVYRNSKGFEIGTFSASLLPTIMKRQSTKWRAISLGYISDAIAIVHQFIAIVLKSICADEQVHTNLLEHLMDELTAKYKDTLQHVHFLMSVEAAGVLRTEDRCFSENLNQL